MTGGLAQFLHGGRAEMSFDGRTLVRAVYRSEILRSSDASSLESYMVDRVPYFYNDPEAVAERFKKGYFVSAIRDVLRKLPTAESFRESHFGEILAGVYGEEILGLKLLYSKLALLTSENANAYKMDLLFFRPGRDPAEFVFAEVKSSMKTRDNDTPAGHDQACFASLFASFNEYKQADLEFDLALIDERLGEVDSADAARIRTALLPHQIPTVQYAGFCVIDRSTHDDNEAAVLGSRQNKKAFDVDLLCVAELPDVVDSTYALLEKVGQ